jgi:Spy/CpxP family protein refolding chaperone
MKMNRMARRVTAAAQLFFLFAAAGLSPAQDSQPAPAQPPRMVPPAVRPMRDPRTVDDFAGLKFTDEQKAKIDEIHRRIATRKDVVVKSEKLNADQRDAMIAGLGRMERGEIAKLLMPEQQREVLKKVHAKQAAAQEGKKQSLSK